jgi:hypothetical protein
MSIKYGVNLSTELKGNSEHKVSAFINRVEMVVYEEIKDRNPSFNESELEQIHLDNIWKAMLEQAYYMMNNYDMNIFSGVDPTNNNVMPISEIRKRAFSPLAKKILSNSGLLYSGLGRRNYYNYQYERSFWR